MIRSAIVGGVAGVLAAAAGFNGWTVVICGGAAAAISGVLEVVSDRKAGR